MPKDLPVKELERRINRSKKDMLNKPHQPSLLLTATNGNLII